MPEIEIRPLLLTDIPYLSNLDSTFETHYVWQLEQLKEEQQFAVQFREVRLPRPIRVEYPYAAVVLTLDKLKDFFVLVAVLAGEPVGFIGVQENDLMKIAWARNLVIKNVFRRKGIGSALILAVQEWAVQRGMWRMVIEMQSKNYPAIQMARKLGYEFCGYNDHYYTSQDIALFFGIHLR